MQYHWHLAVIASLFITGSIAQSCSGNGNIRIRDGAVSSEGRVEVCLNGMWGTVADDGWGWRDAKVACRQLGYPSFDSNYRRFRNAAFGQGTGPINLDNVACVGNEARLIDCPYDPNTSEDTHAEDAGVKCWPAGPCLNGTLRLVNGTTPAEGRIEVCINGVWGTITSDWWGTVDGKVACRQLGYTDKFAVLVKGARYGQNNELPILMDTVQCIGTETQLIQCPYDPLTFEDSHAEDAGLQCFNENVPGAICQLGDIRLQDGSIANEGRVELCINGTWGSVCDDNQWGPLDAQVACRQLGYSATGPQILAANTFGMGTGPVWMWKVLCTGNEDNMIECNHRTDIHGTVCDNHGQDNAIRCRVAGDCQDGDVRLAGGGNEYQGRVEVCKHGVFGTVCDDMWDVNDARVVCRQLGRSTDDQHVIALNQAYFGPGNIPIVIDDVQCTGTEDHLINCTFDNNVNDCNHGEDAGVACISGETCTPGDVRLVNGSSASEGRVEYCAQGVWGSICGILWDTRDARVICRQLGLPTGYVVPHVGTYFGPASGAVVATTARCGGGESSFSRCTSSSYTVSCNGNNVAGVQCLSSPQCSMNGQLRLASGGENSTQAWGRMEVCWNGIWGTIADDGWGKRDCAVACNQLGYYGNFGFARNQAYYGQGTGPIHFDNIRCQGNEAVITNCTFVGLDASEDFHSEDAGCICFKFGQCENGQLRLNPPGGRAGRVEVCRDTIWGTITQDGWGTLDAKVVCRQLGYPTDFVFPYDHAYFGRGVEPIHIDSIRCNGSEGNILQCIYDPNTWEDSHAEDVGVKCFPTTTYQGSVCNLGQIRFVGGPNEMSGRVEVCVDNEWGTVCDKWWGNVDANVACGQKGFASREAIATTGASFGQGTGQIFLNNVACNIQNTSLFNCNFDANTNDCTHARDAGVICLPRECDENDLRLMNGSDSTEGRLEVCIGGRWGTICDGNWGPPEAAVACKQLNLNSQAAFAYHDSHFGAGSSSVWLVGVRCTGSETKLTDCRYFNAGGSCLTHTRDAGIKCGPGNDCTHGTIRLVNGTRQSGRVEVCLNGKWGTVTDDGWANQDSNVVCRQLGFYENYSLPGLGASYGQGSGLILMDAIRCFRNESRLVDCPFNNDTSFDTHVEDAGVQCFSTSDVGCGDCTMGDIRVVDTTNFSPTAGRVEVCVGGCWGTVTDTNWGLADGIVACRQLNFSYSQPFVYRGARYGQGVGNIWLDRVGCNGRENSLFECYSNQRNIMMATHATDASVKCWPRDDTCTREGDIRLAGGTDAWEGRVEVCYGRAWGTISGDNWGINDTLVVCRQLGYNGTNAYKLQNAAFGQGSGPIAFDNVRCFGNETNLMDCWRGLDSREDTHAKDASIRCIPLKGGSTAPVQLTSGAVGGIVVVFIVVIVAAVIVVVIMGVIFWRRNKKYEEDKMNLVAAASFPKDTSDTETIASAAEVANPIYLDPSEAEAMAAGPTVSLSYPEKDAIN